MYSELVQLGARPVHKNPGARLIGTAIPIENSLPCQGVLWLEGLER